MESQANAADQWPDSSICGNLFVVSENKYFYFELYPSTNELVWFKNKQNLTLIGYIKLTSDMKIQHENDSISIENCKMREQYANRQEGQTFVLKETPEVVNHNDKSLEQWLEKLVVLHQALILKYGEGAGGNVEEAKDEGDFHFHDEMANAEEIANKIRALYASDPKVFPDKDEEPLQQWNQLGKFLIPPDYQECRDDDEQLYYGGFTEKWGTYEGTLSKDKKPQGYGRYIRKDDNQIEEGFYDNNNLNGMARILKADGSCIQGKFKDGALAA